MDIQQNGFVCSKNFFLRAFEQKKLPGILYFNLKLKRNSKLNQMQVRILSFLRPFNTLVTCPI